MPHQLLSNSWRNSVGLQPGVKSISKSMEISISSAFVDIRNPCSLKVLLQSHATGDSVLEYSIFRHCPFWLEFGQQLFEFGYERNACLKTDYSGAFCWVFQIHGWWKEWHLWTTKPGIQIPLHFQKPLSGLGVPSECETEWSDQGVSIRKGLLLLRQAFF